MTRITDFISAERERFATEDNNRFAMCFAQISRYRSFVDLILKRYEECSKLLFANTQALQAITLPGEHSVSSQMAALHEEGVQLTVRLHLEIESFYLFAKILLDKIAHSVEFYFGPCRNLSFDSHDKFVKSITKYAEQKDLTLPEDFEGRARKLKKDVSDYRDYEIAHEKSPRRMSGTAFDNEGRMRIVAISLYPSEKDEQVESQILHDLSSEIDQYIDAFQAFIKLNQTKTRLEIASQA